LCFIIINVVVVIVVNISRQKRGLSDRKAEVVTAAATDADNDGDAFDSGIADQQCAVRSRSTF